MEFKKSITQEDKKLAYKEGYTVMVEWLWEMSVQGSYIGSIDQLNHSIDFYFKLNTLPITIFHIKY